MPQVATDILLGRENSGGAGALERLGAALSASLSGRYARTVEELDDAYKVRGEPLGAHRFSTKAKLVHSISFARGVDRKMN